MTALSLHDRAASTEIAVDRNGDRHLVRLASLHLPATGGGKRRFLMVPGNPSQMDHFAANVPWLQERGEPALLDLPGFGDSPPPRHAQDRPTRASISV